MALVGQNGAGKSTLIKVLTGAYRRDAGEIQFDGRTRSTSPRRKRRRTAASARSIRRSISIPFRSVAENIFLGRELRRFGFLDWPRMHDEAAALLRRFAIEIDVGRPLMEFSTAIQQMVAIARAVSFKARLVIMDEPTSSLDEREVAVLFDVIRQLRREGVAVIFITHRLDELYQVCDRVTVMRDGRTVMTAPMASVDKLQSGRRDARTRSRGGAGAIDRFRGRRGRGRRRGAVRGRARHRQKGERRACRSAGGRDRRPAGPARLRTHRSRARGFRRRPRRRGHSG